MNRDEIRENMLRAFAEKMDTSENVRLFFAPGRVNLIGEHTDYNGGHVFPCALSAGIWGAFRKREDSLCRFYSLNYPDGGIVTADLAHLPEKLSGWTAYVLGVWRVLNAGGLMPEKKGFDMVIYGTIPIGSGLSSSAALEVLTGFALSSLFGLGLSGQEIALAGQKAENEEIGVSCGIMDQFASAMGRKDHAIFLNTQDLSYEYVPVVLKDACIVIANTNKKHKLTDSKYNERRSQCETGLEEIRKARKIGALGELTMKDLDEISGCLTDPVIMKRVRHAVSENERTIEAVRVLRAGDIPAFGKLMNASHISLMDDYEVTGPELDALALAAQETKGCIGSRMTGGGFGGCTVSIVESSAVESFISRVGAAYKEKIGYAADFYTFSIEDGVHEVK